MLGYAAWTAPRSPSSRYFEADGEGQWREVPKPSRPVVAAKPAPLFKPQPGDLLAHATELQLDPEVRAAITAIAAKWDVDRQKLEKRLADATPALDPRSKKSLAALRADFAPYTELSQTYDELRRQYWNEALAKLNSKQQARFLRSYRRTEETHR